MSMIAKIAVSFLFPSSGVGTSRSFARTFLFPRSGVGTSRPLARNALMYSSLVIMYLIIVGFGIQHDDGIVGRTQKNGTGCNCHNLDATSSVKVWLAGPSTVVAGSSATYSLYMTGGPAVAGGFNVASVSGVLNSIDSGTKLIGDELTQTAPKLFSADTVHWTFSYQAPASPGIDTLYSVANSVNNNGVPDNGDEWNFGGKFAVYVVSSLHPIPALSEWGIVLLAVLLISSVIVYSGKRRRRQVL